MRARYGPVRRREDKNGKGQLLGSLGDPMGRSNRASTEPAVRVRAMTGNASRSRYPPGGATGVR
jgi:hypothetical protein